MNEDRPPQDAVPQAAGNAEPPAGADPVWAGGPPPGAGPGAAGPPPGAGPGAAGPPPGPRGGAAPADEPPPLTAFAWRNGLVRPTEGRLLAGVCGALGRATNTDPVLWRVLFAVLSIFGGIGVLAYLLGWLMLPADGDTGSPIEALVGRGRSGTSTTLTIIGGAIALLSFGVFFNEPFRPGPFGILLLVGAVLLLLRDRRHSPRPAAAATGPAPGAGAPGAMPPGPGLAGAGSPVPASAAAAPFAPRGPYASQGPPTPLAPATGPYGPGGPGHPYLAGSPGQPYQGPPPLPPVPPYGPAAPPPPPPAPPRPKQPRPKSRLGGLTFSMALLVVGGLGIVDLAGFSVPAAGYIAAALATVGLGLVLGAWLGRARGLIALGIALALVLGMSGVFDAGNRWWREGGSITYVPASLDEVQPEYRNRTGEIRLDLRQVDFPTDGPSVEIDVHVSAGNIEITVPPDVDVTVAAEVEIGNADVFAQSWNGFGLDGRTVTDLGDDGPGGGQLHINTSVDIGNLEVRR